MTTAFEQHIHDVLAPVHRRIGEDVELLLNSLPPGSSIGSHGDGYIVKTPTGSVISDSVAEAYEEAVKMISDKRARVRKD